MTDDKTIPTKTGHIGLIAWFAANPIAANLLMIGLWLGGLSSLWRIEREALPPIRSETIEAVAVYPGASPSEVERALCVPLERAVFDLPGIKTLSSASSEAQCALRAVVQDGYDLQTVLSAMRARLQSVARLPKAVERIEARELNQGGFVINVILHGSADEPTLKHLGEALRDELLRIPGVVRLGDFSAEAPFEIAVRVSAARLRQLRISLQDIADKIGRESVDMPGGTMNSPDGDLLLRTHGRAEDAAALANLPLVVREDGTQIRLGEIAEISDGLAEHWAQARFQGQPAYGVEVFADHDTVTVAERVKDFVAGYASRLPEGIAISTSWDMSVSFAQRLAMLAENAALGFVLVSIVLMAFLNTRVACWAALGIVTSVLGTLWLMTVLGLSLNMLSVFGLLLALGVLVDDAIIVGEAVHCEQSAIGARTHRDALAAAVRGTQVVARPVLLAVSTTAAAFLPGMMLPGWAGQMMKPIAGVMIAALAFSLIEALCILPAHLAVPSVPARGGRNRLARCRESLNRGLNRFVHRHYRPVLLGALTWRWSVLSGFAALLMLTGALVAGGHVRLSVEADATLDSVSARLTLPPGLPYREMQALAMRAEQALFDLRDTWDRRQPPGSPSVVTNLETSIHPEWTGLWVEVAPHARQNFAIGDFVRDWRQRIGELGKAKIEFIYKQGDAPYDVEIELSGTDSARLRQAVDALKTRLVSLPGVYDVADSAESGKPELRLRLKAEGIHSGVTLTDLAEQVRGAYFGAEAQRFVRGREEVKIMVRLPFEERRSLEALRSVPVRLPSGALVPLGSVADAAFEPGQARIDRQNRRPVLKVQARVDKQLADADTVYAGLEQRVLPELRQTYPGLGAVFGQQRRERDAALDSLGRDGLIVLTAIYALIAVPFRSYKIPLIVLLAAPMAWCGAVWAHGLAGLPLSIESLVGMIAAGGVVINDGLVLLDAITRRGDGGEPVEQRIFEACAARFRPILLAFLTTFAGFLPILSETSQQAQFLIPMALSLASGLFIGMLASLVLIPAAYAALYK